MQTVRIPGVLSVTSCCFGGPQLDEMYVTSGRIGLSDHELKRHPNSGAIIKVTGLGVKGMPGVMYEG